MTMTTPIPVIGISAYPEVAPREHFGLVPTRGVTAAYVEMVEAAGGLAVLIPARPDFTDEHALAVLARLDALVLVGGEDVDAVHFGAANHPAVTLANPARDRTELALARVAMSVDLPLLGICRGMQVLAVAAGGTLEQHLPDRLGHNEHAAVIDGYRRHGIRTEPGSRLRDILGPEPEVACHHHQGVVSHPGFVATAWAPGPVLEGMERPDLRFCVGVQSHPEQLGDVRVFAALVAAAS